jgi:CRP-like cAMP-binding protein
MSQGHLLLGQPQPRDARAPDVSGWNAPRRNRLLAALPLADFERLIPALVRVRLPRGWTVHAAGERERYVYFPTSGIVARFHVTASGTSAAFAVTGREGVLGVASFLGGKSTPSQASVLCEGDGYRMDAAVLQGEFERDGKLRLLLLRYIQALISHTGQIAVCNRHHSVEQQLCRWILSCLDRLPSNDMPMTHELIADMLGVRRVGVTEAAGNLQRAGLIHCSRGHVTVLDRPRLLAHACECYAVLSRSYDRMIDPSSRTRDVRSRMPDSPAIAHAD